MTTAEACEKPKTNGFTEEQAAGVVDYVDKRLAEQRGKLKSWFVIVLLVQMALLLGGMGRMLFVATIINHLWKQESGVIDPPCPREGAGCNPMGLYRTL